MRHAVARAGIDPARIDDVMMGTAWPEGATGGNVARLCAIRAGMPISTSGVTVSRFCSSGLQTIAMAAQRVIVDRVDAIVAGGVESVSLVGPHLNLKHEREAWLEENKPAVWDAMIDTARPRREALFGQPRGAGRVLVDQPETDGRGAGSRVGSTRRSCRSRPSS